MVSWLVVRVDVLGRLRCEAEKREMFRSYPCVLAGCMCVEV